MDIMHDILEGTLQYELKELLNYLSKNGVSVEYLNRRISLFPYGYSDISNRPSEILSNHLSSSDHKLRQNGEDCNTCYILFIHSVLYSCSNMVFWKAFTLNDR